MSSIFIFTDFLKTITLIFKYDWVGEMLESFISNIYVYIGREGCFEERSLQQSRIV